MLKLYSGIKKHFLKCGKIIVPFFSLKKLPDIPYCRLVEKKDCKLSSSSHQLIKLNVKHRELRELQTENDFIKKDILQTFGQSIEMDTWKETKKLNRKIRVDCLRQKILSSEAEKRDKEKKKIEITEKVENMKRSLSEKYVNLDEERENLNSLLEIVSQLRNWNREYQTMKNEA